MHEFNYGVEDYTSDEYIGTKEQKINLLCQEYPHFKRLPKGWKISNYYTYYGIPKAPVNRGNNLSNYYLNTYFKEPDPAWYYYAEEYYEHQKTYAGIRNKIEEHIAKMDRAMVRRPNNCKGNSANYFDF